MEREVAVLVRGSEGKRDQVVNVMMKAEGWVGECAGGGELLEGMGFERIDHARSMVGCGNMQVVNHVWIRNGVAYVGLYVAFVDGGTKFKIWEGTVMQLKELVSFGEWVDVRSKEEKMRSAMAMIEKDEEEEEEGDDE